MICIVNVGPHTEDLGGERMYEVRINNNVITTFKHKRIDGLGACLLAASEAVDKKIWEDGYKIMIGGE